MHQLHQSRRKDEKCHSFKTLLCVTSLCPSSFPSVAKPSTRQNSDWISARPQPSSYTYPLHHSSIKTLSYRHVCTILCPKSQTQKIRCQSNSSPCTAAEPSKREVSLQPHQPMFLCKQHLYTSLFFFLFVSPSLTAIKGKRWQQDNCWELLLLYVHKTPL